MEKHGEWKRVASVTAGQIKYIKTLEERLDSIGAEYHPEFFKKSIRCKAGATNYINYMNRILSNNGYYDKPRKNDKQDFMMYMEKMRANG